MRNVKVSEELPTGRNVEFADNDGKRYMSLGEFVTRIQRGEFPDYHIRVIRGIETPVSNPNKDKSDNLG